MTYEKRIVAFLDILGFSNYIEKETVEKNNQEFQIVRYTNLKSLLEDDFCISKSQTPKQIQKKNRCFNNTQVTMFSDSVVISKLFEENNLENAIDCLLSDLYNVLYNGYYYKFVFRGGITCGDMIHSDEYMFGPAFNKAYHLEQKAIYPRIIIDDDFVKIINEKIKNIDVKKYINEDFDGCYYIEPFLGLDKRFKTEQSKKKIIQSAKNLVEQGLKSNSSDVANKYIWLNKKTCHILKTKE